MYCICGKVNTPKTEEADAQNEKDRRATIDTMLSNVRQVLLTGRRGGTCAETKRNSRKASALEPKSKIGIRTFRRTVAQGLHTQRQNVRVEAHVRTKKGAIGFSSRREKSKDQWQLCQVNKDGDTIPAVQHQGGEATHRSKRKATHCMKRLRDRTRGLQITSRTKLHPGPAALHPLKPGSGHAGIGQRAEGTVEDACKSFFEGGLRTACGAPSLKTVRANTTYPRQRFSAFSTCVLICSLGR